MLPGALAGSHQIYAGCWQERRKQVAAGTKSVALPGLRESLKEASWYWVKETIICHLIQVFGSQVLSQQVEKQGMCDILFFLWPC